MRKSAEKEDVFRTWNLDKLATKILEDRGFVLEGAQGSAPSSLPCIWGLHTCSVSARYVHRVQPTKASEKKLGSKPRWSAVN